MMRISGRNQIPGTVESIKKDDVMAQVSVRIEGPSTMVATITSDAVEALGLKAGDSVKALVKASSVMIMK